MLRRPLVVAALALMVVAALVPVLALALAGGRAAADPPPQPSAEGPAQAAPLDPDGVAWVYAAGLFQHVPRGFYTLQAGVLGEPAPLVDLEVPLGADPNVQPGRAPAVGRAVDGTVTFVSDDGTTSTVRRVAIAPDGADEELARLQEVVWALAVSPDGAHAYLALVDRADQERELGVVRLRLDGSGQMDRVVAPGPAASRAPAIVRVARAAFDVDLDISLDGRHLVRRICTPDVGCEDAVIDAETGALTQLEARHVLGIGGGLVLTQQCVAACVMELIDLASGAVEPLPGIDFEATLVMAEGVAHVAFLDQARPGTLHVLDPRDGSVSLVAAAGGPLTLNPLTLDVRLSLPEGYVLAAAIAGADGAIIGMRPVAIPLDGGPAVELPEPAYRPEFGEAQG